VNIKYIPIYDFAKNTKKFKMFTTEAPERRLAKLEKINPSYKAFITQNWNTTEFLNNNEKQNEGMVLVGMVKPGHLMKQFPLFLMT
jgi:hypothetical protein